MTVIHGDEQMGRKMAQAMSGLENVKGAVLVERAGATLYTEINQEPELLKRQEIKILGGIVVE